MAANLANERPIDARTQSREDCVDYISPNSLLLGRTGPRGDLRSFEFDGYAYKRLRAIQTEVDRFWRKWSQLAGPNLFIRSKWHTAHRNVAVGDVVWLADQNTLRGQYELARVISVNTDKKGIIRDVHVRTFPSYSVPTMKPDQREKKKLFTKIPSIVLTLDVSSFYYLQKNKAKPRMNLTLCIHDSCDLPGFKNQEVKREVSRQIKAHWKKKKSFTGTFTVSAPSLSSKPLNLQGAARKSVRFSEQEIAMHFLWQPYHLHTCTPAWEEKFVSWRTKELFKQTVKQRRTLSSWQNTEDATGFQPNYTTLYHLLLNKEEHEEN